MRSRAPIYEALLKYRAEITLITYAGHVGGGVLLSKS